MIDENGCSEIPQEDHKWLLLAILVGSEYNNNSIFRELFSLAIDGQAGSWLNLFLSFRCTVEHPVIESADGSFMVGDVKDDSELNDKNATFFDLSFLRIKTPSEQMEY